MVTYQKGRRGKARITENSRPRVYISTYIYLELYGFFSSHVWMWELDYKESWAQKNWCFWTVMLETTLESPLDCKENQPVYTKGNPSWLFIGSTDAEAETSILWPPDVKSCLIWKDPDAGKDWGQEEKGPTEDVMVGWHHWLNGYGAGWTLRVVHGHEAWHAVVHGIAKGWTWLSDWTELILICILLLWSAIIMVIISFLSSVILESQVWE